MQKRNEQKGIFKVQRVDQRPRVCLRERAYSKISADLPIITKMKRINSQHVDGKGGIDYENFKVSSENKQKMLLKWDRWKSKSIKNCQKKLACERSGIVDRIDKSNSRIYQKQNYPINRFNSSFMSFKRVIDAAKVNNRIVKDISDQYSNKILNYLEKLENQVNSKFLKRSSNTLQEIHQK